MAQKENRKLVREFSSRFVKAFTAKEGGKEKATKAKENDYYALTGFINKLKRKDAFDDCLQEYLKLYTKYLPTDRRSKFVCTLLLTKRIELTKPDDRYLDVLSTALADETRPFQSLLRQRYEDLEDGQKREIEAALKYKRELRKQQSSILDALRKNYFDQYGKEATDQQLLNFDPAPGEKLEKQFKDARSLCAGYWSKNDAENLAGGIHEFIVFLRAQKDAASLFQILKWCRDIIFDNPRIIEGKNGERSRTTTPHDALDCELYFLAAHSLFHYAINHGYRNNDKGFTKDESGFFFEPLAKESFYQQYLRRYKFWFTKAKELEPSAVMFLRLLIFARLNNAELLNDQGLWNTIGKVLRAAGISDARQLVRDKEASQIIALLQKDHKTKLRTKSFKLVVGAEVLRGNVRIGDKFGKVRVAYFEDSAGSNSSLQDIYVEFIGLDNLLFKISAGQLAKFNEANFYSTLWQNTRHLLVLIPGIYQLLGYTFSFVTGGFSALITDVVADVAVGEIAEQADLGAGGTLALSLVASPTIGAGAGKFKSAFTPLDVVDEVSTVRGTFQRGVLGEETNASRALNNLTTEEIQAQKSMQRFTPDEARMSKAQENWLTDFEAKVSRAEPQAIQATQPQAVQANAVQVSTAQTVSRPVAVRTASGGGTVSVEARVGQSTQSTATGSTMTGQAARKVDARLQAAPDSPTGGRVRDQSGGSGGRRNGGSGNGGSGGGGSGGTPSTPSKPVRVMEFDDALKMGRQLLEKSEWMRELKRIGSLSGAERSKAITDFLENYARETGFEIEVILSKNAHRYNIGPHNWGTYIPEKKTIYLHEDVFSNPRANPVREIGHEVGVTEMERVFGLPKDSIPAIPDMPPAVNSAIGGNALTHVIDALIKPPD